jgi:hypothetical protein
VPASTRRKLTLAGIGVAGVTGLLGLGLAISGVASADPSPSPSSSASSQPGPGSKEDRAARKEQRQDELAEALAKELGIDKAKVEAALEKVQADRQAKNKAERTAALKTRLDAAVAEGKLTREQADAIVKAVESGVLPGGGLGGRHGGRPGR